VLLDLSSPEVLLATLEELPRRERLEMLRLKELPKHPLLYLLIFNRVLILTHRYYFKKASDEFDCGAVFEEVWEDETILPMYEGRILGKVERID